MKPYYADPDVTLYHGDMREVLPALDIAPDCIVTDPPYGETSLAWDRWPDGWTSLAADAASSMWCFGSMRMYLDRAEDFRRYWNLSQDVVWRKPNGSGFAADRFRRVHEHALHWYRGGWNLIHRDTPRVAYDGPDSRHGFQGQTGRYHTGRIGEGHGWVDNGTRLMQSVIEYACPPGGLVLDPFAGSGSTAEAARLSGRRAVLIEADERYCEVIAHRMSADVLPIGGVS